jgi:Terminase small subunit
LCLTGISPTSLTAAPENCARYAFYGWLAVILTRIGPRKQVSFIMGKLRNPRRERFAIEVASMVPVDRAYMAAGFRSKAQWARPNGSKLAHVPEVASRISELRAEFAASCALSIEYLQQKLLPAAELNVIDLFGEGDKLKPISKLSRDQGAAISSIKFHDNGEVAELKFVPKDGAVNTLLRSIGGIVDQHAHLHAGVPLPGLGERLRAARERFATQLAGLSHDDQLALAKAMEEGPALDLVAEDHSTAADQTTEDQ